MKAKAPTHNPVVTVDCIQGDRIERLERLQTGTFEMIKELNTTLKEALFPSDLHPDNGLINQMKNMKDALKKQTDDTNSLSSTVQDLTSAVGDLRTAISGINKFMEEISEFKTATNVALELKTANDKAAEATKDKYQRTIMWVIGTAIVVILGLLGYIIKKP